MVLEMSSTLLELGCGKDWLLTCSPSYPKVDTWTGLAGSGTLTKLWKLVLLGLEKLCVASEEGGGSS